MNRELIADILGAAALFACLFGALYLIHGAGL